MHDGFAWDISITCTTGFESYIPLDYHYYNISAVGSKDSSKLIFARCMGYFDRAHYGFDMTSLLIVLQGCFAAGRVTAAVETNARKQ